MERVVVEYGGKDPQLSVTHLDAETDFQGIVEHFREPIARIHDEGGTAAVDVTPGRKFMSAIAFQAGIQFEADHVFYLYVSNNRFYGRLYPDVPRPVVELVDFQEVF
jgi:CRISPR/Cas system-associated protein Csm6